MVAQRYKVSKGKKLEHDESDDLIIEDVNEEDSKKTFVLVKFKDGDVCQVPYHAL